jgi:hypothetical protein
MSGRDITGFLEVIMQVDPTYQGGLSIRAPASDDVLPSEALPVLRFIQQLGKADHVQFQAPGYSPADARISGEAIGMPDTTSQIAVADALSRIQEATGTSFPLPGAWTDNDIKMMYFCDEILRNGSVRWPWPGSAARFPADKIPELAQLGPLPRLSITGQGAGFGEMRLMGHTIELPGRLMMDITDAVVVNLAELMPLVGHQPGRQRVWVKLFPDERTTCRFYLAEPGADGEPGPSTTGETGVADD